VPYNIRPTYRRILDLIRFDVNPGFPFQGSHKEGRLEALLKRGRRAPDRPLVKWPDIWKHIQLLAELQELAGIVVDDVLPVGAVKLVIERSIIASGGQWIAVPAQQDTQLLEGFSYGSQPQG